jgi:serine/threonine protein kinase
LSTFSEAGNDSSKTPGYDFLPGQLVLNTWEVLEPLGRGGMGVVYRVYHRFLRKEMAMKTLRCDQVTAVSWRRFLLEAKAIAQLEHLNIVQIFDMGTAEDGQPFYTMELLNGQGLDRWIRHEPLTVAQSIFVFRQVACALAFAHERGIIHRDIKPANIVLGFSEENKPPVVKVVDFGIAKLGLEGQGLTKEGEVFGSPLYMSPEQASGLKVDQRSDVYSLGCAFYEALTGFPPFKGLSAFETMMMHLDKVAQPIELARPDIKFPSGLSALVQMMLAKNPDQRYSNAPQIVQDLLQIERGLGLKVASRLQTASQTKLEDWIDSDEHQITEQLTIPLGRTGSQSRVKPDAGMVDDGEMIESRDARAESPGKKRAVFLFCAGLFLSVVLLGVIFLVGSKNREDAASVALQSAYFSLDENQIEDLKKKGMSFDAGKKYYRFENSSSQCIGDIGELSADGKEYKLWMPALGVIGLASHAEVAFRPSKYLLAHPQLWRKFRSTDLQAIYFPDNDQPTDEPQHFGCYSVSKENIEELARFTQLESINFMIADVSSESAEILGKFLKLRRLVFSADSCMSAATILKMDCIRFDRLTRLNLPRLDDASKVLAFLSHSKHIEHLSISGWSFSSVDMAHITSLPQLVELHIWAGCLPPGSIEKLSHLPKLEYLSLSSTHCSEQDADEFLRLPRLKKIVLSENIFGKEGGCFRRLEKELQRAHVEVKRYGHVTHFPGAVGSASAGQAKARHSPAVTPSSLSSDQLERGMLDLIEGPENIQK